MDIQELLSSIEKQFQQEIQKSETNAGWIANLRVQYLGKKGHLSQVMTHFQKIPTEQRPQMGQKVNELRDFIQTTLADLTEKIEEQELMQKLQNSRLDPTLPSNYTQLGTLHPSTQIKNQITEFFTQYGFQIESGREVETEWYNFDALNVPKDHPARDMQDTFYLSDNTVLRTQTSNVQIHIMKNNKPPIRVIAPGFVFRADRDASHAPMFQQVEGLIVDEKISFADLKGLLYEWMKDLFGEKIKLRFRPSYFPFTSPSAEIDISCSLCQAKGCRVCQNTGFIEVGGCGCVDPNVFKNVEVDAEKYQGVAFGFGIDRITMLKYNIPDISLLTSNNNKFLKQF